MSWLHLEEGLVRGRKRHTCFLCELPIPKGDQYLHRVGITDGELVNMKMHLACEKLTQDWDQLDWQAHDPIEFRKEFKTKGTI